MRMKNHISLYNTVDISQQSAEMEINFIVKHFINLYNGDKAGPVLSVVEGIPG